VIVDPPLEESERIRANLPEVLLDSTGDMGAYEFDVMGAEASSDLNWLQLLRARTQARSTTSSAHRWWVLAALLAGVLALNFTFTVFIVSLPKVADEFHTSVTVLTWTMTGPLLAYGLAAPLLGKAGDVFGHRRLYLLGLGGAMAAAAATALAPNLITLIGARALEGVQGAATGTASMALIMNTFEPEERVKAMGWWSLAGAGGPVLGVSIGAPVIAALGWRALFWIQLGAIVVAFCVVYLILPATPRSPEVEEAERARTRAEFRRMDWWGSTSLSLAVTALMLALSLAPQRGWGDPVIVASLVVAVVGMAYFVVRIRTAANPLIPPRYFRRRNFTLPIIIRASAAFAYFGAFYLFPLLMEEGYGASISKVGALAVLRPITFGLSAPIAGYLTVKVGERFSSIAGAAMLTASLVAFGTLSTSSSELVVMAALILAGMGMGVSMPASSAVMASEVAASEMGVMSAAQMLSMQVGEVAGIQLLVMLQQGAAKQRHLLGSGDHAALLATFHGPLLLGAAVGLVGVICSCFLRSVPRGAERAEFYDAGH
jgi:EmrB/QacA subfamily drug resistance transporter